MKCCEYGPWSCPQSLDFQGTNTLAYYKQSQITNVKSFIILGPDDELAEAGRQHEEGGPDGDGDPDCLRPGPNVINLFVRNLRIFVIS
jgi:hypothetical protein